MRVAEDNPDTRPFVNPFPFSDQKYEYWSDAHRLAAEQLDFAIASSSPLTLFTGKCGAGKSTVIRRVVQEIQGHRLIGIMPPQEALGTNRYAAILRAFGAQVSRGRSNVQHETLVESVRSATVRFGCPTLIVDEAHMYPEEKLDLLIEVSEIESEDVLFKLLLVGRPELAKQIRAYKPELAAPTIELGPMSEEDTTGYIHHRLAVAGCPYFPLTQEALEHVCSFCGGNPLLINLVCMTALDEAHSRGIQQIDVELAEECCKNARGDHPSLIGTLL